METGIFTRYGLNMVLSRELGWTSVRDEMFYGDLDAAQSISGIAFALGMGFSELRREVAVPLILNLHGNASKHYIDSITSSSPSPSGVSSPKASSASPGSRSSSSPKAKSSP